MSPTIEVFAPDGIGEVSPDTDLAALLATHLELTDGDIVTVTSKVLSKAEGQLLAGDEEERQRLITRDTEWVVARRGPTRIVRHRNGHTMAAAGIDASNVDAGTLALLPRDPDASARALRAALARLSGANVGVVVTDTFGRPWRTGQTDIALGCAGIVPLADLSGTTDAYGNDLSVTAPAVADELAGAAELAKGKFAGRPIARIRGRADLVLAAGDDGPGSAALLRPLESEMFGYGAREAVTAALLAARGDSSVIAPFGVAGADEIRTVLEAFHCTVEEATDSAVTIVADADSAEPMIVRILAAAHGWHVDKEGDDGTRLTPVRG